MWAYATLVLLVMIATYTLVYFGYLTLSSEPIVSSLRGSPLIRWSGFRDIVYQLKPVIIEAGPVNPASI